MVLLLFVGIESIIDMVCNDLFLFLKIYYNLFCLWLLSQLEIKVIFTVFFWLLENEFSGQIFKGDNSLGKNTPGLGFCFSACVSEEKKVGKRK